MVVTRKCYFPLECLYTVWNCTYAHFTVLLSFTDGERSSITAIVELRSIPPNDHEVVPPSPTDYSATIEPPFFYEMHGPTAPWIFNSRDTNASNLAALPIFK
jgi:hypothetical protein